MYYIKLNFCERKPYDGAPEWRNICEQYMTLETQQLRGKRRAAWTKNRQWV